VNLAERDPSLREVMDDPGCDPRLLAATYRRFGLVNRLVAGWAGVYRRTLRPYLSGLGRPARVLDLGCGGGDVAAHLAALARADGLRVQWIGADPDPRAIDAATARAASDVSFLCTGSGSLRESGERFDAVLSNHVLHHLGADEFAAFVDDSAALSSGLVLHGDIERDRLAYALYGAGILPLAAGTFLRVDGLRSIRRSYRAPELASRLPEGWRVERPARFRVLAVKDADA
jgi:2-polyprenyl-3-methyl-5-hydroxy-6-metoxy-1,4-benzoquinol methylase